MGMQFMQHQSSNGLEDIQGSCEKTSHWPAMDRWLCLWPDAVYKNTGKGIR